MQTLFARSYTTSLGSLAAVNGLFGSEIDFGIRAYY